MTAVQMNPMTTMMGGASGLKPRATTSGTTSGQSAGGTSVTSGTTDIQTTFLSLLVQELQNQDPTAPMDSTQMVGQMISLNQLDQLTSIDQVVSNAFGTGSSSTTAASGTNSGTSGGTTTQPQARAMSGSAALAALQALQGAGTGASVTTKPKVSTSVTLPSF